MVTKYTSLKQILDNVLDHPMLSNVSLERALAYTVDFIKIVGCPKIFEEKTQLVEIKDYRGCLPCDLLSIIQVRMHNKHKHLRKVVFRYSTDSFHMSPDHAPFDRELTYKVQNNFIFTSIKNGIIEIAYTAIAVDEDGYPLIPDNSSFTNALELYIKKKVFTVLFDLGKITAQVYENICQQYAWAVGQASNSLLMPSYDEMQAITNSLNTLIPRMTEHSSGFKDDGTQERLKVK